MVRAHLPKRQLKVRLKGIVSFLWFLLILVFADSHAHCLMKCRTDPPTIDAILSSHVDLKHGRLDIGLYIPLIRTESQYDLKGNILLLPLVGIGDAKLVLRNVTTDVYMKITFPKIQSEEVMRVEQMKVDFRLQSCRVHLDNLFNGNKVLGHTVNTFLNKNALEVVEELKENIGESLAYVFMKVMNDAFGRIPTKYWLNDK